jgi:hypothetical protein
VSALYCTLHCAAAVGRPCCIEASMLLLLVTQPTTTAVNFQEQVWRCRASHPAASTTTCTTTCSVHPDKQGSWPGCVTRQALCTPQLRSCSVHEQKKQASQCDEATAQRVFESSSQHRLESVHSQRGRWIGSLRRRLKLSGGSPCAATPCIWRTTHSATVAQRSKNYLHRKDRP